MRAIHFRIPVTCLAALMLVLAAGCGFPRSGPVPGPVTPAMLAAAKTRRADVTDAQLAEGRQLFEKKCDRCHGHPDVTYKTADEWPAVMKRMASRADLTPAQHDDVLSFVLAAREAATAEHAAAKPAN